MAIVLSKKVLKHVIATRDIQEIAVMKKSLYFCISLGIVLASSVTGPLSVIIISIITRLNSEKYTIDCSAGIMKNPTCTNSFRV